jgi:hypothetical protein
MKTLIYFLLFFLCLSHKAMAQSTGVGEWVWEQSLQSRIKQLDEFIARFNYQLAATGKPPANRLDTEARKKQLASLFDVAYIQKMDSQQRQTALRFINQVAGDTSKFWLLSLADKGLYAQAHCQVQYQGKKHTINLRLTTQQDEKQNLRWVIVAAQAPFLEVKPTDTTQFLSPVSHELNFMQLAKITEQQPQNIAAYTAQHYEVEQLPIVLFLIKTKQLKIDFVQHITFHFLQVPHFIFTVKHHERTQGNVGWLISHLEEASPTEKAAYWRKEQQ